MLKIEGNVYGRLTVVSFSEMKRGTSYWNCLCECGNKKIICGASLQRGWTKSCGCYNTERKLKAVTKHGEAGKSPEYNTWQNIKNRTTRQSNKDYKYYGGIGITMCDEWFNDYALFLKDMGRRPLHVNSKREYSIDRIDNTKGYCKENCRWSTQIEQCNNTRQCVKVQHKETGVIYSSIAAAARVFNISRRGLSYRLTKKKELQFKYI